jgi:hypothetical protein
MIRLVQISETAETECLSNGQLVQLRDDKMKEQDKTLDLLSKSVKRQHHLAGAIGDEVTQQNALLDELEVKVDLQTSKIKKTTTTVDKVEKKSSTMCMWVTICLLLLALIGVVVAALET